MSHTHEHVLCNIYLTSKVSNICKYNIKSEFILECNNGIKNQSLMSTVFWYWIILDPIFINFTVKAAWPCCFKVQISDCSKIIFWLSVSMIGLIFQSLLTPTTWRFDYQARYKLYLRSLPIFHLTLHITQIMGQHNQHINTRCFIRN